MKLFIVGCITLMLAGTACAQSNPDLVLLPKGTEIKLAMAQTLNSKHSYIGQRVELQVADDVCVGNVILVPKGTRVLGTVTPGKKAEGKHNIQETVALKIDYIRLGERHIQLTGNYSDSRSKLDIGTTITDTVLLSMIGLNVNVDVRYGEIKEGTELKGFVAEDIALPPLGHAPKPAPKPDEMQPSPPAH